MESNSFCNHTSDKQNRTTAKPRESDLLITSMVTDTIGRHRVLLPIHHNCCNFRKQQTYKGQIYLVETISKVKNSSILEIQQFFMGENDSKI